MITALILTYNEERHILRAISSVQPFAEQILVVDSYSTDRTVAIARSVGADVVQHAWEHNHSRQLNWALDHAGVKHDWVMRLDADEFVTPVLSQEIKDQMPRLAAHISGVFLRRRVCFLGHKLRWGGMHPMCVLRLWRNGNARCESRWMDEHVRILSGTALHFHGEIIDENLNDLAWWINKHNDYARREAADLLNLKYGERPSGALVVGELGAPAFKRAMKERVYARLPLFLRAVLFFLYRYIGRLGFLDGRPGFIWHAMQGLWYRLLVDASIFEIELEAKRRNRPVLELIEQEWKLRP